MNEKEIKVHKTECMKLTKKISKVNKRIESNGKNFKQMYSKSNISSLKKYNNAIKEIKKQLINYNNLLTSDIKKVNKILNNFSENDKNLVK